MRVRIAALAAVSLLVGTVAAPARSDAAPAPRPGATHAVPLYGQLARVYDAPEDPFAPGHRGVDITAPRGSSVRASAPGVVSFSGVVAGNRTVTIDHGGGLLTTYSFLESASVAKGDGVTRGQVIGAVGLGHAGSSLPPHVHLSARRDGFYFDPIELYIGTSYGDLISLTG